MKQNMVAILPLLIGIAIAHPALHKREVPQEHAHQNILDVVDQVLNQNNPDKIQSSVFGLLGAKAAAEGAGNIKDADCLQQATADQAFSNAKEANDVDGMTAALIYRALERNSGKVGQASPACASIQAVNPEIAALQQHQDPAGDGAQDLNKQIAAELAVQIASIGGDAQQALEASTFGPGDPADPTAKGLSCDDANDKAGCINSQGLRVDDLQAAEVDAAVKAGSQGINAGAAAGNASAAAGNAAAGNAAAGNASDANQGDANKGADNAANANKGADNAAKANKGADNAANANKDQANANKEADKKAAKDKADAKKEADKKAAKDKADAKKEADAKKQDDKKAANAKKDAAAADKNADKNAANANKDAAAADKQGQNAANQDAAKANQNADNAQGQAAAAAGDNQAAAGGAGASDFGSCADPTIKFGIPSDGRKEEAFEATDLTNFNHGSALNIKVISEFICDQLTNKCKASADAVTKCDAASQQSASLKGQAAADSFNQALGF